MESVPGWNWEPVDSRWEERFAALSAFAAREGHWRFEEGVSPPLDTSGHGNDPSLAGATYTTDVPTLPYDISNGYALELDAEADLVELPMVTVTNLASFPNGIN